MNCKAGWFALVLIVSADGGARGQGTLTSGVKAGVNVASLHSSLELATSPRPGFHIGFYRRRMLSEIVAARAEIFYSSEGQVYDSISIGFPITYTGVSSTTTVHKLCTPVLIEMGRRFTIDFGAQIGWLLAADNTMARAPVSGSARRDMDDQMTIADIAVVGGIGFHPARKLEAYIRYNHGLSPVFEHFPQYPASVQFRSRVLQATIGYSF